MARPTNLAVAALAMTVLAACEPPPPRAVLTVTTTANGPDTDPGDGVCLAAGGGCSLQAAIEEADHAPDGADVVVPAGSYGGFDATVTGNVRINPSAEPGVTITAAVFTVAAGGHLEVHGTNTSTDIDGDDLLDLDVAGTAVASRSVLERVKVDPGGGLALADSAVVEFDTPSAENAGTLIAVRSSLLAHDVDDSATEAVLHTDAGATSHLVASVVAQPRLESNTGSTFAGGNGTCTGAAPTLASSSVVEVVAPCGAAGPDTRAGVDYVATFGDDVQTGFELSLAASSPLIDAIPLGDPACDTSTVDLYGNPRGVDGDGDGVGGCDIGAVERPTPTITPLPLGGAGNTLGGPDEGYWAHIHGPGGEANSGDSVNTRCLTDRNTNPCTTGANPGYVPPTDPDSGSWYVIGAPPGGGSITVSIFDAQFTPGSLAVGAGDSHMAGSSSGITTTYRMYQQTNPLDFHARSSLGPLLPDTSDNSCHWSVGGEPRFDEVWQPLCTIATSPGEVFLLNVRTAERAGFADSASRNGYGVRACADDDCAAAGQPVVRAHERAVLYNNITFGAATFYLAEVGPEHAGSTLVVEMWDPGEASDQAWIYPRMPSATQPGAVEPVPTAGCEVTSTRAFYPRPSDRNIGGVCSYRSADQGAIFNGHTVTMHVEIPESYTCTPGLDPATTAGSCWWGIRYNMSAQATDTTTWRAYVDDDTAP